MRLDGFAVSVRAWTERSKHPLLTVFAIGLIARLIIMAFALIFDSNYWAIIIRNINAGGGLYDIEGYYYTPVCGYILGLVNGLSNAFLEIGEMGVKVPEIALFEQSPNHTISIVTSVVFNYCSKALLILFDLVASLVAGRLAKELTGDRFRSIAAFSLVWLSLTVMGSSGIIGMPDSIGAAFMVLSLFFLLHKKYLLMGMCFAIAATTKLFPVFLFLPMVFYFFASERGTKKAVPHFLIAAAGGLGILAAIFLPQLMTGDISECFRFITDRTGFSTGSEATSVTSQIEGFTRVICYGAVVVATLFVGLWVYKGDEKDLRERLFTGSFICMTLCMLYPPAPQYVVSLIPLLAIQIAAKDRRFLVPWIIIWISSAIIFASTTPTNLLPLSLATGWPSLEWISDMFAFLDSSGGKYLNLVYVLGFVVQYIGIASIAIIYIRDRLGTRKASPGDAASEDTVI